MKNLVLLLLLVCTLHGSCVFGDVSCYDCYNIPIIGTAACGEPFDPRDAMVETTTCSRGKCAVYFLNETSTKTILQRGCPLIEYLCMSDKPQCMEDVCIDCCSGNLCNGPPTVRSANNNGQNAGNNGQATNRDSNGFNMLFMSLASILLMIGS
ncbi:uncharacterized protein [Asterias amurensis]|uniref:uncharacterized protein n=1 Tax=Asterias amurensis TaxID=7602 RepID=UPI003AB6C3D3